MQPTPSPASTIAATPLPSDAETEDVRALSSSISVSRPRTVHTAITGTTLAAAGITAAGLVAACTRLATIAK